MALAYLLDPNTQISDLSGALNVGGFLRVYLNATDDRAVTYSDFNGTLNQPDIVLDGNGRAVVIADSSRAYRVEVYSRSGALLWTQYPVWTLEGGAGGAQVTNVTSSDGSITVDAYTAAGVRTFDLAVSGTDGASMLDWIRCDGGVQVQGTDTVKPVYTDGTMETGAKGIKLSADQYYHVTAHLRASKTTASPYYETFYALVKKDDGTTVDNVTRQTFIVDCSMGLTEDFEFSTDVYSENDCELLLDIIGLTVPGVSVELLNLELHRIYSGAPHMPGGVQHKLTAGPGIDITNNVISATGGFYDSLNIEETVDSVDISNGYKVIKRTGVTYPSGAKTNQFLWNFNIDGCYRVRESQTALDAIDNVLLSVWNANSDWYNYGGGAIVPKSFLVPGINRSDMHAYVLGGTDLEHIHRSGSTDIAADVSGPSILVSLRSGYWQEGDKISITGNIIAIKIK